MNAAIAVTDELARGFILWARANFWEALLVFMLLMLYRLLWKAHTATGNNFDIKFLLIERETGLVSLKKLGALLALLTTTWIVLFMTVKGAMTEGILGLYMFVWAGVYVTPQAVTAWRQPPVSATPTQAPPPTPGAPQ